MAKIKLTKGRTSISKRNLVRAATAGLTVLNTLAIILVLLKIHNLI